MKNLHIIILLVLSTFFITGCSGNAVYVKNAKTFPATDPATIQVYSSLYPLTNFEVIGYVSTYKSFADHEGDLLKTNLRTKAAQLGANAIIGFKLNLATTGGGGAQGVAVRYLP